MCVNAGCVNVEYNQIVRSRIIERITEAGEEKGKQLPYNRTHTQSAIPFPMDLPSPHDHFRQVRTCVRTWMFTYLIRSAV